MNDLISFGLFLLMSVTYRPAVSVVDTLGEPSENMKDKLMGPLKQHLSEAQINYILSDTRAPDYNSSKDHNITEDPSRPMGATGHRISDVISNIPKILETYDGTNETETLLSLAQLAMEGGGSVGMPTSSSHTPNLTVSMEGENPVKSKLATPSLLLEENNEPIEPSEYIKDTKKNTSSVVARKGVSLPPDESNKNSSVVARKGVSSELLDGSKKIVPRKGVSLPPEEVTHTNPSTESLSSVNTEEGSVKISANSTCNNYTLPVNSSSHACNTNLTVLNANVSSSENKLPIKNVSSTYNKLATNIIAVNKTDVVTSTNSSTSPNKTVQVKSSNAALEESINETSTSVRRKYKPTTTYDLSLEDPLTTDTPPSPVDYIIPISGTVVVVPLLAVLFMFLYKRGAEFWERRHYKRMDFLIDGMYND